MSRILGPNGLPLSSKPTNGELRREGYGGMALPHPLTFAAILGTGWKTYYQSRYDEAKRKDPDFANMMRNDSFLTGLMWERTLAVTSLPWHLEVDDENDPRQIAVRDHLTKQIKLTPKFRGLMKSLQYEGVWYGRTAIQHKAEWVDMPFTPPAAPQPLPAPGQPPPQRDPEGGLPIEQPGQPPAPPPMPAVPLRSLYLKEWKPVSGDKIGHMWDGTPTILVNAAFANDNPDAEFVYNDLNRAMVLRGSWRDRFLVHSTWQEDADFFDGFEAAEAVFGVGARSKVALWQWIRMEWIAKISDFMDRSPPRKVWYWELGNAASEEAVRTAAKEDSNKTDILLPRSNANKSQGVEYLEASLANVTSLMELVKHIEQEYIIPLVNGQKMSRDHTGSGGLGGSGAADMAGDTKGNITEDDANGLAETLTGSRDVHGLVHYLQRHTFPDTLPGRPGGFPVRFVLGYVDSGKSKDRLETIQIAAELVPVKAADVYKAAGLTKPTATDELAEKPQPKANPFEAGGEGEGKGKDAAGEEKPPEKKPEPAARFAADAQGNFHKPPGEGGGQFTGKGGDLSLSSEPQTAKQLAKAAQRGLADVADDLMRMLHTGEIESVMVKGNVAYRLKGKLAAKRVRSLERKAQSDAFEYALDDYFEANGGEQVPLWALRETAGLDEQEFNDAFNDLRNAGKVRGVVASDLRDLTPEQIASAITGGGEHPEKILWIKRAAADKPATDKTPAEVLTRLRDMQKTADPIRMLDLFKASGMTPREFGAAARQLRRDKKLRLIPIGDLGDFAAEEHDAIRSIFGDDAIGYVEIKEPDPEPEQHAAPPEVRMFYSADGLLEQTRQAYDGAELVTRFERDETGAVIRKVPSIEVDRHSVDAPESHT